MLRGVCIRGTGCAEGEAREMGIDSEKKVGGYSGAGIQRAVVIRTRVSDAVVERLAERVAAGGTGLRRK